MVMLRTMLEQRSELGACNSYDPGDDTDIFLTDHNSRQTIADFKSICAGCPVLDTCQKIARVYEAYTNVGGETPVERRRFRETTESFRLLIQAAEEGWLIPEIAVATQEELELAMRIAKRNKPALSGVVVHEIVCVEVEISA